MLHLVVFPLLLALLASCSKDKPAPSAPALPPTGKALSGAARITPSPEAFMFAVEDSVWHTFTVRTNLDSVLIVANPTGTDAILEIAGGNRQPSRNYCPAEENDKPRTGRRNGWNLHIMACAVGQTEIVIYDYNRNELARYAVEAVQDLPAERAFNIDVVLLDDFTEWEEAIILEAVAHWENKLYDIPSYRVRSSDHLSDCGSHAISLEAGRVIDDFVLFVAVLPGEPPWAGLGGIEIERPGSRLPAVGCIQMAPYERWYDDQDFYMEHVFQGSWHQGYVQDVTLHEMGHAFGLGVGSLWGDIVREGRNPPYYFPGTRAIDAYDALPRLVGVVEDSPLGLYGQPSEAILEQPGGILYQGDKVPLVDWAHWGETLGGEVMAFDPVALVDVWPKVSTVSLGALEDLGYPVRYENADLFLGRSGSASGQAYTGKVSYSVALWCREALILTENRNAGQGRAAHSRNCGFGFKHLSRSLSGTNSAGRGRGAISSEKALGHPPSAVPRPALVLYMKWQKKNRGKRTTLFAAHRFAKRWMPE